MLENYKDMLLSVAKVALIVVIAFSAGQRHAQKRLILPQKERVDTLFIRDTILSEIPVYVTRTKTDSIPYPVPVTDTLWKTDTIWLQREQVMWQDSLSKVYASGVSVEIDSVLHFVPTQVISKERDVIVKVKPKWSIGVHAGYGVFAKNGQIATSPYVGVGVSYNILSW
jgi:hypothetical protein